MSPFNSSDKNCLVSASTLLLLLLKTWIFYRRNGGISPPGFLLLGSDNQDLRTRTIAINADQGDIDPAGILRSALAVIGEWREI
jgi:hypothetical protein